MRKKELRDKIEKLNIVVKNWQNRVIDKDEQIECLKEQYEELNTKCDYYEKALTATQKEKIAKLKEQELKEKQAKIKEEKENWW